MTLGHPEAGRISQALIRAGVIGDFRAPDRLRLGPAPITTRFTDVWDAMDTLRPILADRGLDRPAAEPRTRRLRAGERPPRQGVREKRFRGVRAGDLSGRAIPTRWCPAACW